MHAKPLLDVAIITTVAATYPQASALDPAEPRQAPPAALA